jgi:hypothetical protein
METEGRIPYGALGKVQVADMQRDQTALYRSMIKTLDFKTN